MSGNTISNRSGFNSVAAIQIRNPIYYSSNIIINDNTFNDCIWSIDLKFVDSLRIESNYMENQSETFGGSGRGISLDSCKGNILISKNLIGVFGILVNPTLYDHPADKAIIINSYFGANALIINNFIFGSYNLGLLRITNSNNIKILNNSFFTTSSGIHPTYSIPLDIDNSISVVGINNIYQNYNNNCPAIKFNNSSYQSDYNNYFFYPPFIAIIDNQNINDLAQLVNFTQKDSHSVNRLTYFANNNDLHLVSTSMRDTLLYGIPLSEITEDIDGDPRDPLHPYMGADEPFFVKLTLTTFIEGFFNQITNTQTGDTIYVLLRNSTSPYNIVDSAKAYSPASGTALFNFKNTPNGIYYIVIKHRNSIETWSKSGGIQLNNGEFSSYNFTTSASQAFGSNQILKGTKYCIFSGDVNQDGIIDASDLSLIDNDVNASATGYQKTDLNGDNFADASDLSIADNNVYRAVVIIRP